MDIITISNMKMLEETLKSFREDYRSLVNRNLELNNGVDKICTDKIKKLGTAADRRRMISDSYDKELKKLKAETDKKTGEADKKSEEVLESLNNDLKKVEIYISNEEKHATGYKERVEQFITMFTDFFKGNLKDNRLHSQRGLRWDYNNNDYPSFEHKANDNYDRVFASDDLDFKWVEDSIANEIRTIMECGRLTGLKKITAKATIAIAKGNIAVLMKRLEEYKVKIFEEFSAEKVTKRCRPYYEQADEIKRKIEEERNKHKKYITELTDAYNLASSQKRKAKENEIKKSLELLKNKTASIYREAEESKDKNFLEFSKNKDELKKSIFLWLDENFSKEQIKAAESFRSYISDYSENDGYSPSEYDGSFIRMGRVELDYKNHAYISESEELVDWLNEYYSELNTDGIVSVPYIIDFTDFSNIQLKCDNVQNQDIINSVRSMVLRLFGNMKAGMVRFTFIDHATQGQTFAPFMQFISDNPTAKSIINQGTCTTSEHSDEALRTLDDSCRNINSNIYTRSYSNVFEYNEESAPNVLPINVIFVMDYPASLSAYSIESIQSLIKHSKKCGFYFVFVGGGHNVYDDFANLGAMEIDFSRDEDFYSVTHVGGYTFNIDETGLSVCFDEMFDDNRLEAVAPAIRSNLEKSGRIMISMDKIERKTETDIGEALVLPFALVGSKDVRSLSFGHKYANNVIVAGSPGSGKSNALHVILMSALENYSPEEVQIYLLDYKLGVEAYIYSNYKLPHFNVISTTKDCIFGKNVIAHIHEIMEDRTAIFTACNCVNYTEYYQLCKQNPELTPMPRILLVIDELHALLDSKLDPNFDVCNEISVLIKTCLAYGIHMILATQMGKDLEKIDALDMISAAVLLRCDADTERVVLGEKIEEAQHFLAHDTGLAIFSQNRSNSHDNQHVRIAFLPLSEEKERLEAVERKYSDTECETRINATSFANRMDNSVYKFINDMETNFRHNEITIGENLDIEVNGSIKFNGNMLMIGDNTDMARNFFASVMTSVLCDNLSNKTGNKVMFVEISDALPDRKAKTDLIYKFCEDLHEHVEYYNCVQYSEALAAIRSAAEYASVNGKEAYIFIFGLSTSTADSVNGLLANNIPGVHIVTWCNTLSTFNLCVSSAYHRAFNHRIVFSSADSDVEMLTMKKRDLLGKDYALYRDITSPKTAREYAVYKNTNSDWQKKLISKLKSLN